MKQVVVMVTARMVDTDCVQLPFGVQVLEIMSQISKRCKIVKSDEKPGGFLHLLNIKMTVQKVRGYFANICF